MQKKLIALAIAGLSSAAFAQSNVTVYGIADMYVANVSATGHGSTTAINNGGLAGSRIGFKGTEALGNGTSALFVLEYGLAMDANSGIGTGDTGVNGGGNQARQQLVGLTGGWGTAVAGYAQTAGYDWACASGPVAGSALDPAAKIGGSAVLACGKAGRSPNAAAYISPSFGGGFTVALNHARLTEGQNYPVGGVSDNTANLISVIYANGPIAANLTWSKINGQVGAPATGFVNDIKELGLDGSYNFGVAKLFAAWQSKDTANVGGKDTKWSLGVAIPVGATGTVALQYAKSDLKDNDVAANPATIDDGAKGYTLAYTHGLSKRTTLYTGYTRITNDRNGTAAAVTGLAPTAGGTGSVFAAGINHKF